MQCQDHIYVKIGFVFIFIVGVLYSLSFQANHYHVQTTFQHVYRQLNSSSLRDLLKKVSSNRILTSNVTSTTSTTLKTLSTTTGTTSTTGRPTTLDPAELIEERPPRPAELNQIDANGYTVAFLFQTQHHVLASVQMYMIRKLTVKLLAIEVFLDGGISEPMKQAAEKHGAELFSFPGQLHSRNAGPSDRNTEVVNWAITTRAKRYLSNGTAIILLDGDVLPLSPFDSLTLLNSRDFVCRKHPAIFARYCWIGLICLGPQMANTIESFNVSQAMRFGKAYDSGGATAEYLLSHPNATFSYMRETILLKTDKDLFWGTMDDDIRWIFQSFSRCDKCGPEIFFSPFNTSDAVFYHMISATSEWRFGHLGPRRQAVYDAIMKSPYGPNKTLSVPDMIASARKVKKMEVIPMFGNLTCERICRGR